ncbi:MAG: C1 family peptidase [Blastocatellia bacterium]
MKREETIMKVWKMVVITFATCLIQSTATAQTALEQQCYEAVQGKVAWNQEGNKTWSEGNVRNLCQGTTNPSATISCFQNEIRSHNDWSRAITACKAKSAPTPGGGSSQPYQQYVSNAPRKSEVFEKKEFVVRLGAATGDGPSATTETTVKFTGNDESGLPFTDFKNYPDFYVIPPEKRPRIMNQGGCGSCVAWASSTALASVVAVEGKYKLFISGMHMPDAIQLFILSGRLCSPGLPQYAWYTPKGVERLTSTGIMVSLVEPVSNNGVLGGSLAVPVQGDGEFWWIKAGKSGSLTNKDAMRKFIATKGALVADFDVTPDFNYYEKGIYNHQEFVSLVIKPLQIANQAGAAKSLEDEFNKVQGGHAVTVIGYFKGGKLKLRDYMRPIVAPNFNMEAIPDVELPNMPAFWIVQNSWGNGWGMNGLFYIAADQSYKVLYFNNKTNQWESNPTNPIDDRMYYMLEPRVTFKGKDIP